MSEPIKKTYKIPRRAPIRDGIHPRDFRELNLIYCCEQCSYFECEGQTCNLGYKTSPHRREAQLSSYGLSGKMAFCRFLEID